MQYISWKKDYNSNSSNSLRANFIKCIFRRLLCHIWLLNNILTKLPFVEGLKEEDGVVVFLSDGNEDVVIDLVTAERSKRKKNVLSF